MIVKPGETTSHVSNAHCKNIWNPFEIKKRVIFGLF